MHRIALDEHKHYTFALAKDKNGWRPQEQRIEHFPGAIEDFLPQCGGGARRGRLQAVGPDPPFPLEALGSTLLRPGPGPKASMSRGRRPACSLAGCPKEPAVSK